MFTNVSEHFNWNAYGSRVSKLSTAKLGTYKIYIRPEILPKFQLIMGKEVLHKTLAIMIDG